MARDATAGRDLSLCLQSSRGGRRSPAHRICTDLVGYVCKHDSLACPAASCDSPHGRSVLPDPQLCREKAKSGPTVEFALIDDPLGESAWRVFRRDRTDMYVRFSNRRGRIYPRLKAKRLGSIAKVSTRGGYVSCCQPALSLSLSSPYPHLPISEDILLFRADQRIPIDRL